MSSTTICSAMMPRLVPFPEEDIPGKRKQKRRQEERERRMSDRRLVQKGARQAALPAAAREKRRSSLDIDALNGHFGYFIRRLQVWVFQDFIRTLAPIDIRPAQYSVL